MNKVAYAFVFLGVSWSKLWWIKPNVISWRFEVFFYPSIPEIHSRILMSTFEKEIFVHTNNFEHSNLKYPSFIFFQTVVKLLQLSNKITTLAIKQKIVKLRSRTDVRRSPIIITLVDISFKGFIFLSMYLQLPLRHPSWILTKHIQRTPLLGLILPQAWEQRHWRHETLWENEVFVLSFWCCLQCKSYLACLQY